VQVRVIYFAKVRDLVGQDEEDVPLRESMSVRSFIDVLEKRHPRLIMNGVRIAVNEEFVDVEHWLHSGDTVALIPPVSGG
jgi:sulfur-carrier protein